MSSRLRLLPLAGLLGGVLVGCHTDADLAQSEGAQSTGVGVFDDDAPVELRLELPLKALIVKEGDGAKDDVEVEGALVGPGLAVTSPLKVKVKTRGNTSLLEDECGGFPKLKIKLVDRPGSSAFAKNRSFKIATHCGERKPSERTPFGRVANEVAPFREAFAYKVLGALGLNVPRTRPVVITYVDTSRDNKELTRKAALIEDIDDVAERLGGKELFVVDSEAAATDPRANGSADAGKMDPSDIALVHFGEALVGNEDFRLMSSPEIWFLGPDFPNAQSFFWNMKAVALPNGKHVPVPMDFDLSRVVAPTSSKGAIPDAFRGNDANLQAQFGILMGVRPRVSRDGLDQALARVRAPETKAALEKVLTVPWLDDEARNVARQLVTSFFEITGTDASFYGEVVATPGFDVLRKDGTADDTCLSNEVPVGTPIHRWGVVDEQLGIEEVSLLDVRVKLACNHPRVWLKKGFGVTADFPAK